MNKEKLHRLRRIAFLLGGGVLYYFLFSLVEHRSTAVTILHTPIDDFIPFCEYFVIPYFAWFAFVIITVIYFALFNDKDDEYHNLLVSLVVGMACFLAISIFFPNGQDLRPDIRDPQNIFQAACKLLYSTDTPTNILPSLHVYNAVVCNIAWCRSEKWRNRNIFLSFINILTVMIILSTMFLKQHCVIDVVSALTLNLICFGILYKSSIGSKLSVKISAIENRGYGKTAREKKLTK